ncbi:MAG: hypothetical protein NZ899_07480 [Thermoguttaceae bacterium]|nr:hypothetical protein [Thermoguttaceae bacterium]MDW8078984.1 hypothetical protein [Thermoguttaceae bacterium]
MGKGLCIFGLVTAVLLLVLFGLDIATGLFRIGNIVVDIMFIICAAIVGYLSWSALREQW